MTYEGVEYTISDFNLDHALSGGTLFAKDNSGNDYFPVTEFKSGPEDYAIEFAYQAKIQNKTWRFNEVGDELHDTYKLYVGTADITTHDAGDGQSTTDPTTQETTYYSLTSLNYRENVALQVLNAMIFHVPDPISYDNASIKLMVSKAFIFSEEFMSQALKKRTENAHVDPVTGDVVPDASSTEEALNNISTVLTGMKAALIDTSGQTPVSVLSELTGIKTQQQAIKDSLDGTDVNGIAAKLDTIAGNIQTGDTNIVNALGTTGTTLNQIQTNTSSNGSLYTVLNQMDGFINDIRTDIEESGGIKADIEEIKNNTSNAATDLRQIKNVTSEQTGGLYANVSAIKSNSDSIKQAVAGSGGIQDVYCTSMGGGWQNIQKLTTISQKVTSIDNKIS